MGWGHDKEWGDLRRPEKEPWEIEEEEKEKKEKFEKEVEARLDKRKIQAKVLEGNSEGSGCCKPPPQSYSHRMGG